ncbi:MAG: lytic transglycosylase, partial [Deltaproteobacteria bacterium]|nr:lytic transglycosylase [Deltaproteobacteria bacterium]
MTFITAGVFRLLFVTISILMPAVAGGDFIGDIFGPLKEKLIQDGLDRRQVAMAFSPPPPPMFATVSKTLRMREGRLNYSQFLTPASLEKARAFQRIHDRALRDAEIQYGVDSSVIVAILLV